MAHTSLIMALPDPILVVRRDRMIVDSIGGKTFAMDLEPDAIVGQTVDDALPAAFADRLKFLIPRVLRGRDAANETVSIDDRRFELRVSVHGRERVLVVLRQLDAPGERHDGATAYIDEDIVTGLIERQRALALLDDAIAGARLAERPVTLVCVGLRNFEDLCAGLSQATIDAIQRVTGKRLESACVEAFDDNLLQLETRPLLARVSDGAFFFGLAEDDSSSLHERVTSTLRAAFSEPLSLGDDLYRVRLNIGSASMPRDGDSAGELLRNAMAAMREAGRLEQTSISRFSDSLRSRAMRMADLASEVVWALEERQFTLHYQPVYDLTSSRPVAVEAFLRWQHPLRGTLAAKEFVHHAAASGLTERIDDWVLATACADLRDIRERTELPLAVSINLSPDWINRAALIEQLRDFFEREGHDPSHLQLDLTERMLMRSATAGPLVAHLKAMQIGIQLDDFGSGYTSLAQLRRLPIDALKIGGEFTRRIGVASEDEAMCESVIGLAHAYGMRCIAESVERPEQLEFLRAAGCDDVQGDLFGAPMACDALIERLQQPAFDAAG